LFAYHHVATIVLQQLWSCNNHHHARIIIDKVERRSPTAYKLLIVATYCLQHL